MSTSPGPSRRSTAAGRTVAAAMAERRRATPARSRAISSARTHRSDARARGGAPTHSATTPGRRSPRAGVIGLSGASPSTGGSRRRRSGFASGSRATSNWGSAPGSSSRDARRAGTSPASAQGAGQAHSRADTRGGASPRAATSACKRAAIAGAHHARRPGTETTPMSRNLSTEPAAMLSSAASPHRSPPSLSASSSPRSLRPARRSPAGRVHPSRARSAPSMRSTHRDTSPKR